MVDTVLKSSNLLATLINDVLDLSRLEDGSLELEQRHFGLHSVFQEVREIRGQKKRRRGTIKGDRKGRGG